MATPHLESEGNGAGALRAAATPLPDLARNPRDPFARLPALRAARRELAAEVVGLEERLRSLQRGRDLPTACRESRVARFVLRGYVERRRALARLREVIRLLEEDAAAREIEAPAAAGLASVRLGA